MATATLYRIEGTGYRLVMTSPDREACISAMINEYVGYWFIEHEGIRTDTWDAWGNQWLEGDYASLTPSEITDIIVDGKIRRARKSRYDYASN